MSKQERKNEQLGALVASLKRLAIEKERPLWKRLASDLEMPTRQRRSVNLWRIERNASDGETVVVPGKVLGDGALTKKVTIAAFGFSAEAKRKLDESGVKSLSIEELMQRHPDGKDIKIIG